MAEQYLFCETVWDLYSILIKQAATFLFNQENKRIADILEIYRWVVNRKVMNTIQNSTAPVVADLTFETGSAPDESLRRIS